MKMTLARAILVLLSIGNVNALAADPEVKNEPPPTKKTLRDDGYNVLTDAALMALQKAERIELLSLDPKFEIERSEGFHGWEVLGMTELDGENAKLAVEALIPNQKHCEAVEEK